MHALHPLDRRHRTALPRTPLPQSLATQIRSLGLPPRQGLTELDSTGCDHLDPGVVQLLVRAVRRYSANGRALVIRHASPALRRQLIQEGLAGVLRAPGSGR